MNNKAQRMYETRKRFIKRVKRMGCASEEANMNPYRSTGKPCSCYYCAPLKYSRREKHRATLIEDR